MIFVLILSFLFGILYANENLLYCDRKWPSMDIVVPVRLNSSRDHEWSSIFLNSFLIFWPAKRSNVSIIVVIDEELKGSFFETKSIIEPANHHKFKANYPNIEIKYHCKILKYRNGHDRQQHLMFYPELYTDKEYVGFADSDCLISTYVDREDIFENGKPVVHGVFGLFKNKKHYPKWAKSTFMALNLPEPMICMSYFPVVFKVVHIIELRRYIQLQMNCDTFEEAFAKLTTENNEFSQFNVMCAYVFWKKMEDYSWVIHDVSPLWDGFNPAPEYGQWGQRSVFRNESFYPKPYIALHTRYHKSNVNIAKTILRSMCHTNTKEIIGVNCSKYLERFSYHKDLHIFEGVDHSLNCHENILVQEQKKRHLRFEQCDLSYGREQFNEYFLNSNIGDLDY